MDDHIRNPYVQLLCVLDIRRVEVAHLMPKYFLHLVQLRACPGLDQSVVDALLVYLADHLIRLQPTQASLVGLVVQELLAMGWCISDMEDVSEYWSAVDNCPVQVFG